MERTLTADLESKLNSSQTNLKIQGWIERIRDHGNISFIMLRDRKGSVQAVIDRSLQETCSLNPYDIVTLNGRPRMAHVREGIKGIEFGVEKVEKISGPEEPYPIAITPKSTEKLDRLFDYRPISLRNPKIQTIFTIQADVVKYFRKFLTAESFTEIFSPKIVAKVAESGANMFELNYFGKKAFLTQSPQFYKQIMVGSGMEKVFEVGHAYRAEEHDTSRHLNEYVSMDLEMGFIDDFHDLMDLEESLICFILGKIKDKYGPVIKNYYDKEINIPEKIPRVPLKEAVDIIKSKYNYKGKESDIDSKGEKLVTKLAEEEYNSELIFLTHYPIEKRPFYTMPSKDKTTTESFDLIYKGLEITTGGQRIHAYDQLIQNINRFCLDITGMGWYLMAFKYGMPPHGGMGIGLERLTARILNLENVKEASLFPRDKRRIEP